MAKPRRRADQTEEEYLDECDAYCDWMYVVHREGALWKKEEDDADNK